MQSKTAKQFIKKLELLQSVEAHKKCEGLLAATHEDSLTGVRMRQVFALAKEFIEMPLDEIEILLESPIHKIRLGAVSIMDFQARSKKTSSKHKKELFNLYIRRHDRINTWGLVDRSAIHVVGGYLFDKPRDALCKLAKSPMMAERRTAIVSTIYFISQGDTTDTFKIAKLLLGDKEDLVHRAIGWALRTASGSELLRFLDENAADMPRITLRYAIEKLDQEQKGHYLSLKK